MPLTRDLTKFSTATESILSFDWSDTAKGIGYINYYPCETEDGKILATTTSIYATNGKAYSNATSTTFDEDFDLVMGKATTIEGDVLISIPVFFQNNKSGNPEVVSSNLTLKIRHWDGTTETDLATGTVTATASPTGSPNPDPDADAIYSFSLTVANTHFAEGDTLRYSIAGTSTGHAQLILLVYRDPAARVFDSEMDTSRTTISIPIKINN